MVQEEDMKMPLEQESRQTIWKNSENTLKKQLRNPVEVYELEIRVYGRVHGMNFRVMTRKAALERELKGRVFNRRDGSVEIIAQGSGEALQEFLRWIESSPGLSEVQGLHYQWRSTSQNFTTFSIVKDAPFLQDQARSFLHLGKSLLGKEKLIIPRHVAIIPDGNRRWAQQKGLEPQIGHYTSGSFQHVREILDEARAIGVEYLTIWGFSTENWKRSSIEIRAIFDLLLKSIEQFRQDAHMNKIRFRHLGRKDRLPSKLMRELQALENETASYSNFHVQLCLDYVGRDELLRAVNSLISGGKKEIAEEDFEQYLDSVNIPDIDLIIRTSGEQRLSGFMPFQSTYAELYFSTVHFPDFNAHELRKAIEEFSKRQRRFGG